MQGHCYRSSILRKFILIIGLSFVVSGECFSQVGGLKAGLNLSTIRTKGDWGILPAYYVGIVSEKKFSELVRLKNEFVYSLQGTKGISTMKERYHYLNAPILLSLSGKKLSFDTGPQVGLLLNAVAKGGNDKRNSTAAFNIVDVSYCIGGTYRVVNSVFIETRFNVGLSNNARIFGPLSNQVFQLGLRYNFINEDEK